MWFNMKQLRRRKSRIAREKKERGMALVFALLGILLLSMLAAALMFVTSAESFASFHYKSQTQATYAALAGVQRTVEFFKTDYGTWINPMSGLIANNPPIDATDYVWATVPQPTFGGNLVQLGDSANFPTDTEAPGATAMAAAFITMRDEAAVNTVAVGNTNASFRIVRAQLLSHERYKALDGVTDRIIERWRVWVTGTVQGFGPMGNTTVQETAVIQTAPRPILGNAIHGQCEVNMVGSLTTDSFYSTNGTYNNPPGSNIYTGAEAGASVASNSFAGSSGSSGTINGDLYYGTNPDTAATPPCTSDGESVTAGVVQGEETPFVGVPFPPITPSFTTGNGDDCRNNSAFEILPGIYRYTWTALHTPTSNDLGDCVLTGSETLQMRVPDQEAPVNFYVSEINIGSATSFAFVQHTTTGAPCSSLDLAGLKCAPVQLYVKDRVRLGGGGLLSAAPGQCDPTRFTIFYEGTADADLGGTSGFCGTLYAPNAHVNIAGDTQIWGAVTARSVTTNGGVIVHYDKALERIRITVSPFRVVHQTREVN